MTIAKALPLLLLLMNLILACQVHERCYDDKDCPDPQICSAAGSCKYICNSDADCGQNFACRSHLCVLKPSPPECERDEHCAQAYVCTQNRCVPKERECQSKDDCEAPKICSLDGLCRYACEHDDDCDDDFECKAHNCVPIPTIKPSCPDDMALIGQSYCIDKYEASRIDASETSAGSDESMAQSAPNVLPWLLGPDNAKAEAACQAAGKRLCTPAEWETACKGTQDLVYPYGNEYEATTCNGIDTYGLSGFHLAPTASHTDCKSAQGVYDLSGNVWEHTAQGSGKTVRGGAFNCADSRKNHRCDYVPRVWTPSALGFRCCSDAKLTPTQAFLGEGEASPSARASSPNSIMNAKFCAMFRLIGEPLHKMRSFRICLGDPALPPLHSQDSQAQMKHQDEFGLKTALLHDLSMKPKTKTKEQDPFFKPVAILAENGLNTVANDQSAHFSEQFFNEIHLDWQSGNFQEAISKLKDAQKRDATNTDITRALGISYARVQNFPWAMRQFRALLKDDPYDCQSRAWLAWSFIQMADLDEANSLLARAQCRSSAFSARLSLLQSYQALLQENRSLAKERVEEAKESKTLYKSDALVLDVLSRELGLKHDPNLTWQIDLSGGYASNAISAAPNDPVLFDTKASSGLFSYDARLGLDPLSHIFVRPALTLRSQGQFILKHMDFSFIELEANLGIILEGKGLKFGASYHPQALYISGNDQYGTGPLLYYLGHRLELDLEILNRYYIFSGYGLRKFRHISRTRQELDIGIGAYHPLPYNIGLAWGASYKYWNSYKGNYYNLHGFNASVYLDYRFSFDMRFRLGSTYTLDDYPHSAKYFDVKARRDHSLRGSLQIWSPAWYHFRIGLDAKAARRWTTASLYAYEDYRAMLVLRWSGSLQFYKAKELKDDLFALPWTMQAREDREKIRDIIQQDEDLRGSSSCINR
ncbi:MAG: SUMF1/EgtB/PvdO family nonheme iron enzyme [Bradymonadales bacterium]|jgi:sulfatase modifying factor 1